MLQRFELNKRRSIKRALKAFALSACAVALLFGCSSCSSGANVELGPTERAEPIYTDAAQRDISNDGTVFTLQKPDATVLTLTAGDINAYEGFFEAFNSHYFKNFLSNVEKTIYSLVIYMTENGFSSAAFEGFEGLSPADIEKVIFMAAGDYPSLEVNLKYGVQSDTVDGVNSYVLRIDVFQDDKMQKNRVAFEAATELIATIPSGLSDYEKGAFIYKFLVENIKINLDVTKYNTHYLYSALHLKETNCDGFANAVCLLFNMAGIETFKVLYSEKDLKEFLESEAFVALKHSSFFLSEPGDSGHVWNVVKIDSRYYYVDAMNGGTDYSKTKRYSDLFYCFSDDLQKDVDSRIGIDEYYPACDSRLKELPKISNTQEEHAILV